jgi:predicted transcriptional regulator
VMERLWSGQAELTARQVADELPDHAYTTVATVLERLANKGLLTRRRDGRVIKFSPVESEIDHTVMLMGRALSVSTDRQGALAQFARCASAADARTLLEVLETTGVDER